MRRFVGGFFGLILGAGIGVPVSYLFQNRLLRMFMGLGDYCELMIKNLDAVLKGVGRDDVPRTFVITVAAAGLLGMLLGALIVGSGRKRSHPDYHEPRRGFPPGPPPPPPPGQYSI
ncbi:MAG TPA: hypothetical protein VK986_14845 [Tepidisphaeraceae bacterium]|nr:hypothetical protein [Tepidisphaeraceae bacterium]